MIQLIQLVVMIQIINFVGVVYDFQGPYTIGKTTRPFMAFGPITRSFRVDVSSIGTVIFYACIR